jgi:hypothetical protein
VVPGGGGLGRRSRGRETVEIAERRVDEGNPLQGRSDGERRRQREGELDQVLLADRGV